MEFMAQRITPLSVLLKSQVRFCNFLFFFCLSIYTFLGGSMPPPFRKPLMITDLGTKKPFKTIFEISI